MKRIGVMFYLVLASAWALSAQESVRQLARILAEKGILTSNERVAVEGAEREEAVRMLSVMLYQKGILSQSDMARVHGPAVPSPGEVRFAPAVMANGAPAAQAPKPQAVKPKDEAPVPPVTSAARFPLQVYGTVLWNAFYNTAGTNIEDIPLVATKRGTDPFENFGMTARQSRFGLRYQGPTIMGGKLGGVVEMDLLGGKTPFGNGVGMDLIRLRLAYGRLDWNRVSIEAGQDWTVFSPLNPTSLASFAIPAMSASGNPWIRTPQFRAEWRSDTGQPTRVLFQAAALDPNIGDNPTAVVAAARTPGIGERGRGPAVESRLAVIGKMSDRDATVGLSGHYNRGKNVGVISGNTVTRAVDSWGVNLDYTLPFHKVFLLTGEAFAGRALGIFSVSSGQAVLPVATPGEHGVLARGGWAQAQINFNPKWQLNLVYGLESVDGANLRTGDRGKNQTYMTNLMYKLSPHVTWAWEWRRLLSDYRNQQAADAIGDHINMAIAYIF